MHRPIVAGLIAVVLLLSFSPHARAEPEDVDKTLSPYFVIPGADEGPPPLSLRDTAVEVSIDGVIASVKVRQTYENHGKQALNPTYVFPASTRAAVHGLTMRIGERVVRAQIKEREEARREFERAEREGKTATLLEQERANVFRMSLANVMPGDVIAVELHYSELLVPTDRIYELVYPTVVGPRFSTQSAATAPPRDRWVQSPYTHAGEPPTYGFSLQAKVAAGMPIAALQSPSHTIDAKWNGTCEATVTLSPKERAGGNRDFILRYRLAGDQIQSGLLLHEDPARESFFLLTVQPPERVLPTHIPGREYVFVVDVSGSMYGFPLDTAKHLLQYLIADLRPTDTFNLVFFSGGSQVLAPRSLPATPENLDRGLRLLDSQDGGGGTMLLPALQRAMSMPHGDGVSRNFVVITDGYISSEKEVFDYIRANLGEANVFAFGIGSSVNRYLIEGIARAGLGEPFVVIDHSQSFAVANQFREYIRSPVLTDIAVRMEGFDAYDLEPAVVPDVLADRPVLVQGKWRGKAKGRIVVEGRSGSGAYRQVFDVADAYRSGAPQHEALRYLWARNRVATVSDFGSITDDEREQIVALGLTYNLLTDYTSFVAVYEQVRNTGAPAKNAPQPLPMPEGVSDLAIADSYGVAEGPEPALWMTLMALIGALGARVLGRKRGARR